MIDLTIKEIKKWIDKAEKKYPNPTSQQEAVFRMGRLNAFYELLAFLEKMEV